MLEDDERKLLLRDRPRRMSDLRWSDQDVALLDEARTLLDGAPRSYGHVIVDEAQDLSPMQLLAISRRAVDGSLTILGDVAQATGPVVYRRWQELQPYLPDEAEMEIEELRHAYRVPAEIMDFALPLLDRIAPEVEPPLAYRKGGDPPRLVQVGEDELLQSALREAVALEDLDGLLAVIVPRSFAVEDSFPFPILTPRQAKGLEFDHVVVVEPAAIADDGDRGLRELYVALTRPTKTLVVVHARPLPEPLGARQEPMETEGCYEPEQFEPLDRRAVRPERASRTRLPRSSPTRMPRSMPMRSGPSTTGTRTSTAAASPTPLKILYGGAAGMAWGLDELRRSGHAETTLDLAGIALDALDRERAEPDATADEHYRPGSLLDGEAGPLLVAFRLTSAATHADELHGARPRQRDEPHGRHQLGRTGDVARRTRNARVDGGIAVA